jgi:hypothetical protein
VKDGLKKVGEQNTDRHDLQIKTMRISTTKYPEDYFFAGFNV